MSHPAPPPPPPPPPGRRSPVVAVVAAVVALLVVVTLVLVVLSQREGDDDGDDGGDDADPGTSVAEGPGVVLADSFALSQSQDCDVIDLYSDGAQEELGLDEAACEADEDAYFDEQLGCELEVTDEQVAAGGDEATVEYRITGCDDTAKDHDEGTAKLVREAGEWRLDAVPDSGEEDEGSEPLGDSPTGSTVGYFALLAERDCRVTFVMTARFQAEAGGDGAQCASDPDAYFGVSNTAGCEFEPGEEQVDGTEATVEVDVEACEDPAGNESDVLVHLVDEDGWKVDRFTPLE